MHVMPAVITNAHCPPSVCFRTPPTRTARMTTRPHLSSQPKKVTTCFVLGDFGGDPEIFANIVDGEVSFSTEPTKQTSPTPIAFNAVDTGEENIFNIHTANDDDGPRSKVLLCQVGITNDQQCINFLYIDGTTELDIASAPTHQRPEQSEDDKISGFSSC